MKDIVILGSTGSIGRQTLEIVRKEKDLRVVALAAARSVDQTEEQIREFSPALAVLYDEEAAKELASRVKDTDTRVLAGMEGLIEAASYPTASIVVTAVVGMIGIRPTIAAIEAGKDIALANKETLVTAGHIIMPLAKERGVKILPVDSEHSAIFQCLQGASNKEIEELLLTASGGPFFGRTREELRDVRPEEALKHPNWNMGKKITIDSATLVNKGLEVMEARWLFDVPIEKVRVVVQPKSVIHSMVAFVDGAVLAQLGTPDMRLPIQYALYYPERRALDGERLDFASIASISFASPDPETFRGLALAIEAGKTGGSMPTVFNAANEEAVALFLDGRIGFPDIYEILETAMRNHTVIPSPDLSTILSVEQETRDFVKSRWT